MRLLMLFVAAMLTGIAGVLAVNEDHLDQWKSPDGRFVVAEEFYGEGRRVNGVFINRQTGSGTRIVFDRLLQEAKISPAKIQGSEHEEFTHLAVAATIASGHAEAGIGIEAAAHQYQLDFIPLFEEEYFFACRKSLLESNKMQQLLVLLTLAATAVRE